MIEKIGKQENLPQKMGIISILKMKIVIFFRFFIFLHVKTFLFSTPCFRYPIFFLNFFFDGIGYSWSSAVHLVKNFLKLSHQQFKNIFKTDA